MHPDLLLARAKLVTSRLTRWIGLALRQGTTLSGARLGLLATVAYFAATVAFFHNLITHMGQRLLGPPEDNLQDLWNTYYAASHVHGLGDFLFTNLIKFPEGTALFYHDFVYPKMALAILFGHLATPSASNLLILQNFLILMSFPISGVGAFYLVRHFTRDVLGALIGGYVFAFNPSHVEHAMHHLAVSSIDFVASFALCFILTTERREVRWLALSCICYVLSALSSWYYAFYCLYFMLFVSAVWAWRNGSFALRWPAIAIGAHLAGLALFAGPLLARMVSAAVSGAPVYADGTDLYVADLVNYVSFPVLHPLGWLTAAPESRGIGNNEWEATVYLGLANLSLLAWLLLRRRDAVRGLVIFLVGGMALFAILASGDYLHVLGNRTLPMPDLLLERMPFFRNVRAPSRAILFVYLFLAIGVGLAIRVLSTNLSGRWRGAAVAIVILLVALDWAPNKLQATEFDCSPGYQIIAATAIPNAVVLDLPLGNPEQNSAAMAYQICHGKPIVGGVVSRELTKTLRDRLITDDLAAQRNQLRAAGVAFIVIHRQNDELFAWPPGDADISRYLAVYPTIYSDADITLMRVE